MMNKLTYLVLTVTLLLGAFGLRVMGVAWGQPDPTFAPSYAPYGMINDQTPLHPDEYFFVALPFKMTLNGTWNPDFLANPSLLINAQTVLNYLTGATDGFTMQQRANVTDRHVAPFASYVVGRVLSALGGLLAVASTIAIVRLLTNHYSAWVMGLLVGISLPLVQHAHYSTMSSLATGFAMCSVFFCLLALGASRQKWGVWHVLSGVFAGLATGSRYNVGLVSLLVLLIGVVCVLRHRTWRDGLWALFGWLAFPLTFVFTTPFAVLDFDKFLLDLQFISTQYLQVGSFVQSTTPLTGMGLQWQYGAVFGVGIIATCLAIVGLLGWWRIAGKRVFLGLLCLYLLAYALLITRTVRPVGADQLMVPMMPVMAIFASVGFWLLIPHFYKLKWAGVWRVSLVVAILIVPLYHTLMFVRQVTTTDNRYVAQEWVYTHLPKNAFVRLLGNNHVPLDPQDYRVEQIFGIAEEVDWANLEASDYLIVSDALEWQRIKTNGSIRDNLPANAQLLWRVYRPLVWGYDWQVYTVSYWHNPTLSVYCLNEVACNATMP
jgi:hypothetical protein